MTSNPAIIELSIPVFDSFTAACYTFPVADPRNAGGEPVDVIYNRRLDRGSDRDGNIRICAGLKRPRVNFALCALRLAGGRFLCAEELP